MYRFTNTKENKQHQSGFTLVEILVATSIFVVVVSAMLSLFNYTLQINRRVQSLREIVQGTRAFTETVAREIRNGKIDYNSPLSPCNAENYNSDNNQSLGLITLEGDKVCFYFGKGDNFVFDKQTSTETSNNNLLFDSQKFRINQKTFRFAVNPRVDPNPSNGKFYPGVQPFVTIVAQFELLDSQGQVTTTIDYQTTISTDSYDIPPFKKS